MSISKAQQTRLGIFMLIGLILFVILVSVPIGFKLSQRQKKYFSYFTGESLSGLEQGATVKFKGIPIGKVDKITYDSKDLSRVKVVINIRHDFPTKKDMYIQTGMMGITGLKYVEILGGSNNAEYLKPNSEIPVKQSLIASITGKSEVLIGKVELLLNHLNVITSPESFGPVKKIIDNTATITDSISDFMSEIKPNITGISLSVYSIVSKIDSMSTDLRALTKDINEALSNSDLSKLLANIDSTTNSMKKLAENMDLTLRQTREDFASTIQNIHEASENTVELTKLLAENPSLLLRSEQGKERKIQ